MRNKSEIRNILKEERRNLSDTLQQQLAGLVYQQVVRTSLYEKANHLAFYWPVNGELDLRPLWAAACQAQKQCYFPVITEQQILQFYPAGPSSTFNLNKFNIPEPAVTNQAIALNELDIILIPLLAFDDHGHRLGMGAGYYDRTLAQLDPQRSPVLIGIAYEFQHVTALPSDPWDIPLDYAITDKQLYSFV